MPNQPPPEPVDPKARLGRGRPVEQAGIATQPIDIPHVRWNDAADEFRGAVENRIQFLSKLYP